MADVENLTAFAATAALAATAASAAVPQAHAKKEKKRKTPRARPSHPPTSEMVTNAIRSLKERGGSSLQAIKKFVPANYNVDAERVAPLIRKYLKGAVSSGSLVQTKGKGATGSFKLASSTSRGVKAASVDKKKPASSAVSKAKKSAAKRAGGDNRSARAGKKPSSPKAKKAAAEKKSAAVAKGKKAAAAKKKAATGARRAPKAKSS